MPGRGRPRKPRELGGSGAGRSKSKKSDASNSLADASKATPCNGTTSNRPAETAPEELIVEKITGKRYVNDRAEMLVKWKGFPSESSTWEPYENLTNCVDMLQDFESELSRRQEVAAKRTPSVARSGNKKSVGEQPSATKASAAANQPVPAEAKKAPGPTKRKQQTRKPREPKSKDKVSSSKICGNPMDKPRRATKPVKLSPPLGLQLSESSDDETPSCSFGKRAGPSRAALEKSTRPPSPSASLGSLISSKSDSQPLSMLSTSNATKTASSLDSLKEQARQWQASKNLSKFGALLGTPKKSLAPAEAVPKGMAEKLISATLENSIDKTLKDIPTMQLEEKAPKVQTPARKRSKKSQQKKSEKDKKKKIEGQESSDYDWDSPLTPENWKMPLCKTVFGLARGLDLDQVVHSFRVLNQHFMFVTWKGLDVMDAVPLEKLKVAHPAKVLEYFEKLEHRYE